MKKSSVNPKLLHELLKNVLTDQIENREVFMKGIDYSYFYEEVE